MITGDRKNGLKYRDLIINQIKDEINPNAEDLQKMIQRLNNSTSDDLERTYQAFERFGVRVIMEQICQ